MWYVYDRQRGNRGNHLAIYVESPRRGVIVSGTACERAQELVIVERRVVESSYALAARQVEVDRRVGRGRQERIELCRAANSQRWLL